jgi:FdhD protein
LRPRGDGVIHPVARPAFLRAFETNPLNFKSLVDQLVEIDTARDHVSSNQPGRAIVNLKCAAELIEDLKGKKCDLPFVIVLEIQVTVTADPAPGDALDYRHLNRRICVRLATVVPDKIVVRRNVKMTDFHRVYDNIRALQMKKESGIGSEKIIRRKSDGTLEYQPDDLTIEEPLEIRVGEKVLATTMRTPGCDEELAAGFLVAEALIRQRAEITGISATHENTVVVEVAPGIKLKLRSAQRFGTISSSCGICGKTGIEAIRQNFPEIKATDVRIDLERLLAFPGRLRRQQGEFARTGGIHAAGIFDLKGNSQIVREDIGRHNAVDKAIGRAFLDGLLPLGQHLLLVSGRASFEIMQKALAAGIPIVAAVSAPSTLAVNFARESNQTLIGFLRPPSFNIYSHIERVKFESAE